jgi:LPS O-antigen subunit length determinant protein (WzzB/FepE family)
MSDVPVENPKHNKNQMPDHTEDEIDLLELARKLWLGRRVIAVAILAMAVAASAYLNLVDRKYSVSMVLKSVQEPAQTSGMAGLGGIASLAGIELPSGSNMDFTSFPLLMQSREVAQVMVQNEDLMRRFYLEEWDPQAKTWRQPDRSAVGFALSHLKSIVTGNPVQDYSSPNAVRLSEFVSGEISASIDSKSDLLNVKVETKDPELMQEFIAGLVFETDQLLRQRFITEGTAALEFYKEQLLRAQSGEHREALAQLIVQEEQKLMLATRSNSYVAEILRGPDISMKPTSPKSMIVLALSMILGLFAGFGIVLVRGALSDRRTT